MSSRRGSHSYVPALRFSSLTALYDPVVRFTLRERLFKSELVRQVAPPPQGSILDLGCGTGTLTLMLKRTYPQMSVSGVDGDLEILKIAEQKRRQSGMPVDFRQGFATQLPYSDECFDRVVSSLMLHHLSRERKIESLKEVRRILKPGGTFHLADWDKPSSVLMRLAFLGVRILDGFENTRDHEEGNLPKLLKEAGLRNVTRTRQYMTLFGTVSLFSAKR